MASECHMDYFDDAIMVLCVSFWRHEDNSLNKITELLKVPECFQSFVPFCPKGGGEEEKQRWREIKEHQNVREATRAGEQRGNNISALTLKAQLGELKHTTPSDLPPEESLQGAKLTDILFVSRVMKSRAVIGHWQKITESVLNGMEINTAASGDFRGNLK